jgi:hypothetical protein
MFFHQCQPNVIDLEDGFATAGRKQNTDFENKISIGIILSFSQFREEQSLHYVEQSHAAMTSHEERWRNIFLRRCITTAVEFFTF